MRELLVSFVLMVGVFMGSIGIAFSIFYVSEMYYLK